MAALPTALLWHRLDAPGAEQALLSDRTGLHARGTVLSASPIPFSCRYELHTDESWSASPISRATSAHSASCSLAVSNAW